MTLLKKIILFTVLNFNIFIFASEINLDNLINPEYKEALKKNGVVSIIHKEKSNNLILLPSFSYSNLVKKEKINKDSKNISFTAEFLYLIPKSLLLKNSKKNLHNISIENISVVLRSISKMQGMRYHVTDKSPKGELLYKKAYMIASPDSNDPIPDQIEGSADGKILYCYQHDNTYNDIKYKLEYHQNSNEIYASFLNTSVINTLGVKMIMPENLKINAAAVDCDSDVLLYLSIDTNCKNIKIINVKKQLEESMSARIEAIYQWFLLQF